LGPLSGELDLILHEDLKPRRLAVLRNELDPPERVDRFQPIAPVPAGFEAVLPKGHEV